MSRVSLGGPATSGGGLATSAGGVLPGFAAEASASRLEVGMADLLAVADHCALLRRGVASVLGDEGYDLVELDSPLDLPPAADRAVKLLVAVVHVGEDGQRLAGAHLRHPALPIVAILFEGTTAGFVQALVAGATAAVSGHDGFEPLVLAVHGAMNGLAVLPTAVASAMASGAGLAEPGVLSPVEQRWLTELARGATTHAVAH